MPDNNFEQQARDMVNGFEMEPLPARWQFIRDAIGKPKRRRRIMLWWWLLPLCMAGGVAIYTFTHTITAKETSKKISKGSESISGSQKNTTGKSQDQKTDHEINITDKAGTSSKQGDGKTVNDQHTDTYKKQVYVSVAKQKSASIIKEKELSSISIASQSGKTLKASEGNLRAIGKQENKKDEVRADNTNMDSSNGNVFLENKKLPAIDNPIINPALNAPSGNSVLKDTAAVTYLKKQKPSHAWYWGILAEGGVAARSSSLLSLASLTSSDKNAGNGLFNRNDPGTIISGGSTGVRTNRTITQTKNGAALAIGLAAKKRLNRTIDLVADFKYHYQSVKISAITYSDSIALNNSFPAIASSYTASQAFHFVSAYTGINWHFINKKNIGFGISAGVDNLFLLTAKQNIKSANNGNFSQNYLQRMSDSTFTKSDYYRYQPGLFAGISVNVKTTGNTQLQFIPFIRSSFRVFEKQTAATNNHLLSAGLRAVYFFK